MENLVTQQYLHNHYKNKRVFITGHTGFKGAWLLKILHLSGAIITGYALAPNSENDLYKLIEGDTLCNSVIGDLRNYQLLKNSIITFEPDYIFHLAAQPLVKLSYEIPTQTFEVNAIGTANLLDAVRFLTTPCCCVMITTDKVYRNNEWVYPYRETDRLGGFDPYSASKACTELIIDSYTNSFFHLKNITTHHKKIAVARAGNVIGGGDWNENRLLPDIAKALGKNEPIVLRNPASIRPWQHVLEPLVGYLTLATQLNNNPELISGAFNFGPNDSDTLTVKEMAHLAIKIWGAGSITISTNNVNQPHEASLLKLDINKAKNVLNWQPKLNTDEAITLTIEWYKTFFNDKKNISILTENQILQFIQRLK